jgi:hypothetical protein
MTQKSRFNSWKRQEVFLFAMGPTQPPVQCVLGAVSPEVKWLGCEADHSPPSSIKAKNGRTIPTLSCTSSW